MTTSTIADEAESYLRNWSEEISRVKGNECLLCYVARLLGESPCDGHLTHALRYRDMAAPRATALGERLGRVGGFCDCEIFVNGYHLASAAGEPDVDDEDDLDEERDLFAGDVLHDEPDKVELPPCQGVRRGTVKPCGNWVRIRRW